MVMGRVRSDEKEGGNEGGGGLLRRLSRKDATMGEDGGNMLGNTRKGGSGGGGRLASAVNVGALAEKVARSAKVATGSTTPVVFLFTIILERIEGCNGIPGNVVLILERTRILFCSPAFKLKDGAAELSDAEINKEVTLFRNEGDGQLNEKLFKVALRSGHQNGKTKGKIHIDVAQYADISGEEKKLRLKLSNGGNITVRVKSQFIQAGKRDKGSDAASQSSAGTYMTSSDIGSDDDRSDLDDLDDLTDLETDIDLESSTSMSSGVAEPSPAAGFTTSSDADIDAELAIDPVASSASRASAGLLRKIRDCRKECRKLEEDNARLRGELDGTGAMVRDNEVLRRHVRNMEEIINRQKEKPDDLVGELTDVKIELANEEAELDDVKMQINNLRKKKKKKKSKWPKVPRSMKMF